MLRDPDASKALKCAVRWEPTPNNEPVSYDPGQRYAAFTSIAIRDIKTVAASLYTLFSLPSRFYAEKPSDASVRLSPVGVSTVAAPVFRGADASWDGPISAEQLHGWLWATRRAIWPSRCVGQLNQSHCLSLSIKTMYSRLLVFHGLLISPNTLFIHFPLRQTYGIYVCA